MRKTEPSRPSSRMLRDIGLSDSRRQAGDDDAAELIRLSGDPLLLHDHLLRRRREVVPPSRPLVPSGLLLAGFGNGAKATPSRSRAGLEPPPSDSLRPESFAPTEDDRRCAVDEAGAPSVLSPSPAQWLPTVLIVGAVALVLTVLLLIP